MLIFTTTFHNMVVEFVGGYSVMARSYIINSVPKNYCFARVCFITITRVRPSHKKRKDSLGTRAKLVVQRTYVENQAILEPILLYFV